MQTQRIWWDTEIPETTIGLDLGDRKTDLCILNRAGAVIERSQLATAPEAFERRFRTLPRTRIVLEIGTHSPWIGRQLESYGHEVLVANTSLMCSGARRKKRNDRLDAESLARRGRADPALLFPLKHRSEEAQTALAVLHVKGDRKPVHPHIW